MNDRHVPDPLLDARELALLAKLTEDYKVAMTPSKAAQKASALWKRAIDFAPERIRKFAKAGVDLASDAEIIKTVLKHAGKGFEKLSSQASRFTLSKEGVVSSFRGTGLSLDGFDDVATLRSYDVERIARAKDYQNLLVALTEGAITGAPGFIGIPFNIALSFFLYFRAVQSTALFYGYDVKEDPRELEIAATATIACFSPQVAGGAESVSGLIAKMMLAANLTALRRALGTKTYTEMAKRGGSQLLYVQLRGLAHQAAARALKNAGRGGLEAGIFRDLLEQVGRLLPKQAGKKSVPVLGAIVGSLTDTYYMNRVLHIGNLIYHKRFLFEKEERIRLVAASRSNKALKPTGA